MVDKQKKSRIGIVAIWILFLFPVVSSYVLFYSGWQPLGTTNYGELVNPARPLVLPLMDDRFGEPVNEDWIYGKWTMVYFAGPDCDAVCREQVILSVKIRLGENRNALRLQNMLLFTDQAAFKALPEWLGPKAAITVAAPLMRDKEAVLKAFDMSDLDGQTEGRLFLVDPQGNLMMRFPAELSPQGIRKDLKRLFKISQVG